MANRIFPLITLEGLASLTAAGGFDSVSANAAGNGNGLVELDGGNQVHGAASMHCKINTATGVQYDQATGRKDIPVVQQSTTKKVVLRNVIKVHAITAPLANTYGPMLIAGGGTSPVPGWYFQDATHLQFRWRDGAGVLHTSLEYAPFALDALLYLEIGLDYSGGGRKIRARFSTDNWVTGTSVTFAAHGNLGAPDGSGWYPDISGVNNDGLAYNMQNTYSGIRWETGFSAPDNIELYVDDVEAWDDEPPVGAADRFTLSGPNSGQLNVASAPFTVAPNGQYTGTITLAVLQGQGVLNPTQLVWNASAQPQTFRYTPTSGTGIHSIGASANPVLLEPSPWSYNVITPGGPVISNVNVGELRPAGTTIHWLTDVQADSRAQYGQTPGYGATTSIYDPAADVTTHVVPIGGLQQGTWHFLPMSVNGSGQSAYSQDGVFTLPAARGAQIHCLLDSVTYGQGLNHNTESWPARMALQLPDALVFNPAIGGSSAAQWLNLYAERYVLPFYPPSGINIVCLLATGNGGDTINAYNDHVALCDLIRADGTKVIIGTVPPRCNNVLFANVNDPIRANWQDFADGFVEINELPTFGDPCDPAVTLDGTHPTAPTQQKIADAFAAAVNALISPLITHVVTGKGELSINGPKWVRIEVTHLDTGVQIAAGADTRYFGIGDVSFGTENGMMRNFYISHTDELIEVPIPFATRLAYSFRTEAEATITELQTP